MKTNFSCLYAAIVLLASCSAEKDNTAFERDEIRLESGKLGFRLNKNSVVQLFYNKIQITSEDVLPSAFLICGTDTLIFDLDITGARTSDITTGFGKGKKIDITGHPKDSSYKLEQKILLEVYERYPDAIITSVSYTNKSSSAIEISKAVCNRYSLDASLADRSKKPYEFSIFSGASHKWGEDDIDTLRPGFFHKGFMGMDTSTNFGGGIPAVDLWNKNSGLAIAQIEPYPVIVSFPVKVNADQRAELSMEKVNNGKLLPGAVYALPRVVTIAHQLDYFDPLKTYAALLADQGIFKKQASAESYEPVWCTWGYGFEFSQANILASLPRLREMGIHWIVIDDRWFDRYGDWKPRKEIFPGGEKELKEFVATLHQQGFKVQIWWYPSVAQGTTCPPKEKPWVQWECKPSELSKQHPEWFVLNKEGDHYIEPRVLWSLCPSLPGVNDLMAKTTERFLKEYDFDGIKIDALYEVPPCYNEAHKHRDPEESYRSYPDLMKTIYEKAKDIKPGSVIFLCNCGSIQDFFQIVHTDQPATSDPTSAFQNRNRTKYLKALCGADCPVFGDFAEIVKNDFASAFGVGAVPGTEFSLPGTKSERRFILTPEKEITWKKWFSLYAKKKLPKGNYLNLYDIAYDIPETHVIQKGDTVFYSFYAKEFNGKVKLRGLGEKKYTVTDYINDIFLGNVQQEDSLQVKFSDYLLVECIPAE